MIFEITDLDPKLDTCRFGPKIAICQIFMKYGTQNKSNMPIMNKLIGIDDSDDPKLQICQIWPKTEMCLNFYEIWDLEQIKHSNYEFDDLDPKL